MVGLLLVSLMFGARALEMRERSGSELDVQDPIVPANRTPGLAPSLPGQPSQGLGCIRGGTTREEVRAIMGEPDSVAFGDWIYGRSSVTFGYGVVLDYSNASGDLKLCP